MTIPFFYHLKEFKFRLLYIILTWFFLIPILYFFGDQLLFLLIRPKTTFINNSEQSYFIFTNITEAFQTYMELALFFSTFLCVPIILYHVFIFLIPGLYQYEKNFLKKSLNIGLIAYILGTLFVYFIILPISWEFFSGFEINSTESSFNLYFETKLNEYLSFVIKIFLMFSFLFQLCVMCFIYFRLNKITFLFFVKKRRYAYLICFLLATLITPPDFISQLLIGFPLIIIYEIYIFWLISLKIIKQVAN
jgi:sec-independent protein translocase protein TatC